MVGLIVVLIVAGTTIWVGFDSAKRDWNEGSGTLVWVLGSILLWIVVFPLYLVKRGRAPLKGAAATRYQSADLGPSAQVPRPPLPPPVPAAPLAPPGWYPDPRGLGTLRYWAGTAWTEHTSAQPVDIQPTRQVRPATSPITEPPIPAYELGSLRMPRPQKPLD
jgi:hypothetical protein